VHSDHHRQACCDDNRSPGPGLVYGYGRRDRDGQPSRSRHQADRGNCSGELTVLDEEVDRPPDGRLLFAREVVGATSEDAGRVDRELLGDG
jgi:hypothetical protein